MTLYTLESGHSFQRDVTLHQALILIHAPLVDTLLEQGTPVNTKDEEGKTPLHIAVTIWSRISFTEKLLHHGAAINAGLSLGWTPLHVVFSMFPNTNTLDMCALLISAGGRVKEVQSHKTCPTAQWQKHMLAHSDLNTVNLFLQCGYSFTNIQDIMGHLLCKPCVRCNEKGQSNSERINNERIPQRLDLRHILSTGAPSQTQEIASGCECVRNIEKQLTQPLQLQRLAANMVREALQPNAWVGLKWLNIPACLHNYILLKAG